MRTASGWRLTALILPTPHPGVGRYYESHDLQPSEWHIDREKISMIGHHHIERRLCKQSSAKRRTMEVLAMQPQSILGTTRSNITPSPLTNLPACLVVASFGGHSPNAHVSCSTHAQSKTAAITRPRTPSFIFSCKAQVSVRRRRLLVRLEQLSICSWSTATSVILSQASPSSQ